MTPARKLADEIERRLRLSHNIDGVICLYAHEWKLVLAALRADNGDSRSELRRIAAQKGEPAPTFEESSPQVGQEDTTSLSQESRAAGPVEAADWKSKLGEAAAVLDEIAQRPDQKSRVQYVARLLAASPPAPAAPGWVAVPIEMPMEMLAEMWRALNGNIGGFDHDKCRYVWTRTLAAAPSWKDS